MPDLASGGLRKLGRHIREGHQSRACHLVEFAFVTLFGQRRDGDIGDVVNVDDGLDDIAAGHRKNAGQNRIAQVAFREVLREPGGPDDGEVYAGMAHHFLAQPRMVFTAPGEQHKVRDVHVTRRLAEGLELFHGSRKGEIGKVGHIGRTGPAQGWPPGLRRLPVEGRRGVARAAAHRKALRFEAAGDATAGLAGGADDENVLIFHGVSPWLGSR